MNFKIIIKTIGIILVFLAISIIACQGLGKLLKWESTSQDSLAMIFSAVISFVVGMIMFFATKKSNIENIYKRESIIIVTFGWVFVVAFGSLPYILSSTNLSIPKAFFESMSGFTTTGASILTDIEASGKSILLWRSMTQWIGGVGFLVLFVAILSLTGQGSVSLFKNESSAQQDQSVFSTVRQTAISLWNVYIIYTILCTTGLYLLGMSFFDALNHGLTTMATGGFSTKNTSIAYFTNTSIHIWITIFMILASINFLQIVNLTKFKKTSLKKFITDQSIIWLIVTFLASTLIVYISISEFNTSSEKTKSILIVESAFQTASIISTTGFATTDFNTWSINIKVILLLLMFIGGCAGSTAGGIKINRIISSIKIIFEQLIRSFRPNQIINITGELTGEKALKWRIDILTLFFLAILSTTVSVILITIFEPNLSFMGSISTVVASLFNIGPGFAEVGPTQNFAFFTDKSLILLSIIMLIGRLEFITAIVIILPIFWKKY